MFLGLRGFSWEISKQYQKNCELINMIQEHRQSDIIMERVQDIICQELEIASGDFLSAYQEGDADAMVLAITGWNLESLLAKAKIIPDVGHTFCEEGDVPTHELFFPLYGKETWTEQEFLAYIRKNYTVSVETIRFIQNAISYAAELQEDTAGRQDFLWAMIRGTIGLEENIVRKVVL